MNRVKQEHLTAYMLLAPALLLFLVFTCYPFLYGFFISLNNWDGFTEMKFVGFGNYAGILKDAQFYGSLGHNFLFAFANVIGKTVLSVLLAVLLNGSFRGVTFFRTVYFTPVVISTIALSVLWQRIYDPNLGILDTLLINAGIIHQPILWLADPRLALWSLAMVDIWKWTGYHTVLNLAGLQTIPNELYESSDIDGASRWKKFRYITLPLLKPVLIINITIATMGAFSVFDLVYIMTNGGPYNATEVLQTYMYRITFGKTGSNFGYGSAVAYILFIIIFRFLSFSPNGWEKMSDNER